MVEILFGQNIVVGEDIRQRLNMSYFGKMYANLPDNDNPHTLTCLGDGSHRFAMKRSVQIS